MSLEIAFSEIILCWQGTSYIVQRGHCRRCTLIDDDDLYVSVVEIASLMNRTISYHFTIDFCAIFVLSLKVALFVRYIRIRGSSELVQQFNVPIHATKYQEENIFGDIGYLLLFRQIIMFADMH